MCSGKRRRKSRQLVMKWGFGIFFLTGLILLSCLSCGKESGKTKFPSRIDSLTTEKEVKDLLVSLDSNLRNYEIKPIQDFKRNWLDSINGRLAERYSAHESFVKNDLDQNGYTDLLVIGDGHYCQGTDGSCSFTPLLLMNFGTSIEILTVSKSSHPYERFVPVFRRSGDVLVLRVYDAQAHGSSLADRPKTTDLVYKFGRLVEYNAKPDSLKIEKIEFKTTGCFGKCPVYDLKLSRDSAWVFTARRYNFSGHRSGDYYSKEGVFSVRQDDKAFSELSEMLNYSGFSSLKEENSVSHTDDQTADLKITFDGGKVKVISDYGMTGTYALDAIYERLGNLRFDRKWMDSTGSAAPPKWRYP